MAYALVFGSVARGTPRPESDVDVALGLFPGASRDAQALGGLAARLTAAAGREAHVVLLDEAPAPLAYRIFRDGRVCSSGIARRWSRERRVRCSSTSISSPSRSGARRVSCALRPPVVDSALLAARIATVRDATSRIRSVLPRSPNDFLKDRTTREVVTLNLFVAIQACLDLAAHWLADAGLAVPATYGEIFAALAAHGVMPHALADRLAAAAAFRNLVAHQYGALDWTRVHAVAVSGLDDLEAFCAALASGTA